MRYVLALACLVACATDPSYRLATGEIVPVPWRCKDDTYVGSWRDVRGHEHSCPWIVPLACPDGHGGIQPYFIVSSNAFVPDVDARPTRNPSMAEICDRIRVAGH